MYQGHEEECLRTLTNLRRAPSLWLHHRRQRAVCYLSYLRDQGPHAEGNDEIFRSTGIAADDNRRKTRMEREIGLLALLGEDSKQSQGENVKQADVVDTKGA